MVYIGIVINRREKRHEEANKSHFMWIEMKSIMRASRELELLVQLMPSEAHLVWGDQIIDVKTEELKAGNLILIKKMAQNLVWATGYNVVALPLAAGILYKAGIMLSPAVGAILMSVSTVVVAINARILKPG